MATDVCAICGRPTDAHDLHYRFTWPDPVLQAGDVADSDIWMSGQDANTSMMMQINHLGAFVRALLSVKLTEDHQIAYGLWVGIDPAELNQVFSVWWEPAYRELALDGYLANSVKPWDLLGRPVSVRVLYSDQAPYCVSSPDRSLSSVLTEAWDHELVLPTIS